MVRLDADHKRGRSREGMKSKREMLTKEGDFYLRPALLM